MHPPVSIRPATAGDIPHIRQIAEATWPVAYKDILAAPQLRYMLDMFYSVQALETAMNDGQIFLLAFTDGEVAPSGFAAIGKDNDSGDVWKLHKLYVLPQVQSTGTGRALLINAEAAARAADGSNLILNVNRHNIAVAFYMRNGYRKLREEDIDIGSGYFMNDFVMGKSLTVHAE